MHVRVQVYVNPDVPVSAEPHVVSIHPPFSASAQAVLRPNRVAPFEVFACLIRQRELCGAARAIGLLAWHNHFDPRLQQHLRRRYPVRRVSSRLLFRALTRRRGSQPQSGAGQFKVRRAVQRRHSWQPPLDSAPAYTAAPRFPVARHGAQKCQSTKGNRTATVYREGLLIGQYKCTPGLFSSRLLGSDQHAYQCVPVGSMGMDAILPDENFRMIASTWTVQGAPAARVAFLNDWNTPL
ncbi:hypothetical protein GGX14DRAFT_577623 [Mycena pura]|uniref:Uncharacterized protein n=1 Tax=Mycena pura TaxID=153505 RepID=A0AAD6UT01_9AGAR|nr:hypothetical protein GGX14DRAFT_577623 [Mycena pura]